MKTTDGASRTTDAIETRLTYVAPGGSFTRKSVLIRDARLAAVAPSLSREAFALRPHATAVRNFFDPDEVRAVY